ncbi:MAG: hypothetical protein RIN56_10140 [Sporomusaceae bacterium]|nr:hypothetical protein [Sporomusaceae bacterium]
MGLFLLWSARVLGALATAFFLSFFAGEGIPALMRGAPPDGDLLIFLPLLLIAVAGYFAAWRAEAVGGRLLVVGGGAMMLYHLAHGDPEIALIYGLPFIITGALYIFHQKLSGR